MELTAHCSLVRAYVMHANAHDVAAIGELLDRDARYASAHAGELAGRDAILAMMRRVFAELPDVSWTADGYEVVSRSQVAFDFRMRATDGRGQPLVREGREVITFTAGGRIACIRVGGRDAAPRG